MLLYRLHICIERRNFTCCFVWLWNLIRDTKGRALFKGEQGVEENIWTCEGGSGGKLEKTA